MFTVSSKAPESAKSVENLPWYLSPEVAITATSINEIERIEAQILVNDVPICLGTLAVVAGNDCKERENTAQQIAGNPAILDSLTGEQRMDMGITDFRCVDAHIRSTRIIAITAAASSAGPAWYQEPGVTLRIADMTGDDAADANHIEAVVTRLGHSVAIGTVAIISPPNADLAARIQADPATLDAAQVHELANVLDCRHIGH